MSGISAKDATAHHLLVRDESFKNIFNTYIGGVHDSALNGLEF